MSILWTQDYNILKAHADAACPGGSGWWLIPRGTGMVGPGWVPSAANVLSLNIKLFICSRFAGVLLGIIFARVAGRGPTAANIFCPSPRVEG